MWSVEGSGADVVVGIRGVVWTNISTYFGVGVKVLEHGAQIEAQVAKLGRAVAAKVPGAARPDCNDRAKRPRMSKNST